MRNILVIQTAFAGDLILTTPLITEAARCFPSASVDVLCIPATAPLLENHPAVRRTIIYDKRAARPRLLTLMRQLHAEGYDLCLTPHRSLRSALLSRSTSAAMRICFDRATGAVLATHRVRYDAAAHEVTRNLLLLTPAGCAPDFDAVPTLYPSDRDRSEAATVAFEAGGERYVCIAPGSVWATKRWTEEGFAQTARALAAESAVIFIGGSADRMLCARIAERAGVPSVNAAGRLSLPASAALIGGAALCVSNDSAPVHMASAMGTPVVEIFGATVPAFGFTPVGVPHRIVQHDALECRPCAIHGGERCPIGTFACMRDLASEKVLRAAQELLAGG